MNLLIFQLFISFFLFSLCLFAIPPQLAERPAHFTALYEAIKEVAGESAADLFFEDWTDREFDFYEQKARPVLAETRHERQIVPSANTLHRKYGTHLLGILGEIYAMVKLRQEHPDDLFFDEIQYAKLNPRGNKNDGFTYRIEKDPADPNKETLVITRIVEAKMGYSGFENAQAIGCLQAWKNRGIVIPTDKGPRRIASKDIVLKPNGTEIPINKATVDDYKKCVILITPSNRGNGFAGEVRRVPFDTEQAKTLVKTLLNVLHGGRPSPPLPPVPKPFQHAPFDSREEFVSELNAYISKWGDWPKNSKTDPYQDRISREMKRLQNSDDHLKGQADIFIKLLTHQSQQALVKNDRQPALPPFEIAILSMDAPTPQNLEAIHWYLSAYARTEGVVSRLKKILESKPAGAKHFESQPFETLIPPVENCRLRSSSLRPRAN